MIIGQSDQPGDKSDAVFTQQVKDFLFTDFPPSGAGHDLPARNIQRGRDHGIPGESGVAYYQLGNRHRITSHTHADAQVTTVTDKCACICKIQRHPR